MTTFQTRLSRKHDNIRRKILDRNINLQGHVTDTIRIRTTKNREGDVMQHIVESADFVNVSYSPMKDVPIRDLVDKDGQYIITSLVSAVGALEQEVPQYYIIQAPRSEKLRVDDLLFRVFIEPDNKLPSICGLIILESLATFGANSVISNSYKVGIYTEDLPQKIINVIVEMAKRRIYLKY